jgi:hypothetical protein
MLNVLRKSSNNVLLELVNVDSGSVRGGQNYDHLPSTQSTVEVRTVRSSTCEKIEVEGTIFDFYFSEKFDL